MGWNNYLNKLQFNGLWNVQSFGNLEDIGYYILWCISKLPKMGYDLNHTQKQWFYPWYPTGNITKNCTIYLVSINYNTLKTLFIPFYSLYGAQNSYSYNTWLLYCSIIGVLYLGIFKYDSLESLHRTCLFFHSRGIRLK